MSTADPFPWLCGHDSDAVLLDAERELAEWLARADAQRKLGASNSAMEPLYDEIGKRAETIYNTPPSTLLGAVVKLRTMTHPDVGIGDDEDSENVLALRQLLALIEREIGLP